MFKKTGVLMFTLISLLASPGSWAHKVNLFAFVEGDEVFVEGYFVDGKRAQNSAVTVYSPVGDLLVEGITNDEGQYRFVIPDSKGVKIVLNAGMGHQAELTMSADELGQEANKLEDESAIAAGNDGHEPMAETPEAVGGVSSMDPRTLDAAVQKAVNEAIKPLVKSLAESQEKASLSGIVGGVGYIVGFLGLFAFMKARQMTKEPKS